MNNSSSNDIHSRIAAALQAIPAAQLLGISVESAELGCVVLSLPMKPELAEHTGLYQGGIIGAFIDFAGATACGTLLESREHLQTIDYSVKLLAPAKTKQLFAVGRTLNDRKRSVMSAEVSVLAGIDEDNAIAFGFVSTRVLKRS